MNEIKSSSFKLLDPFNWLEPLIPLVLAIHGSALLLSTNGTPTQWVVVLLTFTIAVVSWKRQRTGAWETRIRRILLFSCAWLMMASHAGVSSFFFFWMVVLTVTFPLLVPLKEGQFLPILMALSYWALIPISSSFPPRVVIINKFFHLNIIGYLVYSLAALRARSVVRLWNAETALREKDRYYRLLAEHTSDLVGLHQPDGTFIYVSPSVQRLLGYPAEDILNKTFDDLLPVDSPACPVVSGRMAQAGPYRVRHRDGHNVWLETKLTEILDSDGAVTLIQSTSRDVTERIEVELQLRHHALHDSLTHLPNRRCFMERFEQEVARSRRIPGYGFALLQIDLDSFKEVNDSWGHASGDRLLEKVSERIASCIRDSDLAARMGGDEFIILMVPVDNTGRAEAAAGRILSELKKPIQLELGQEVTIGASIGIVLSSVDYVDPQELMRYADSAMYRAKQAGRGRYVTYDPRTWAESNLFSSSKLTTAPDFTQPSLLKPYDNAVVTDLPEATLGQN